MRVSAFRTLQVSVLVLGVSCPAWSWGHQGHQMVNALKAGWILKPQAASNELDLRARIFRELLASYRERDAVLAADREAVAGRSYVDPQYFPAFGKLAGPLAEKRLKAAVSFVSSLWYTAWVRAGRPALLSATGQWQRGSDAPGLSGWERHTTLLSSPCSVSARIQNEAETDRSAIAAGRRHVCSERVGDVPFHAPSVAAGFMEGECSRRAEVRPGERLRRLS